MLSAMDGTTVDPSKRWSSACAYIDMCESICGAMGVFAPVGPMAAGRVLWPGPTGAVCL